MNDFTQNVKYKAPDILRNNLDRLAQKLEVKGVPEAKLPITLKPLKKIIKPIIKLNKTLYFLTFIKYFMIATVLLRQRKRT